jgi:hypothetical protein
MVNRVSNRDVSQVDVLDRGEADIEVGGETLHIRGLPERSHASLTQAEDGTFNLELRVTRADGEPPVVFNKSFADEAAVRAWANNDSAAIDLHRGDAEHNAFERLRHSVDITGSGRSLRLTCIDDDGVLGEHARAAATFFASGRRAGGWMGGTNRRRQDTLIELGFLDRTFHGRSNSDGLTGERTRGAVDQLLDWAKDEHLNRADLESSQAATDRFVDFAGRIQSTIRTLLADPTNDDLLKQCGLTQADIDRYRQNPGSFMIRDHVAVIRNTWRCSENCTNTVREALAARPASPAQRQFMSDVGQPRNVASYFFVPEHVRAFARYVDS